MSLAIQFIDNAQNTTQDTRASRIRTEGTAWIIPEVILGPVGRLPHMKSIAVSVTGRPSVVAQRIQRKFNEAITFDPLRQLIQRESLGNCRVDDVGPVPPDVLCDLTVTVVYFDSDGRGKSHGPEQTITETCRLYSTSLPEEPTEVLVRPAIPVTVDEPVSLTFEVRHPKAETPRLALVHPTTVLAPEDPLAADIASVLSDLRDALTRAVQMTPVRQARRDGVDSYVVGFTVKLSEPTKGLFQSLEEPLLIPLEISIPGGQRGLTNLMLEVSQQQFGGWLVIDFGTTNSTVTLFQRRGVQLDSPAPEPDAVLRRRMGEWFQKPAAEALPAGRMFESQWRELLNKVGKQLGLGDGNRFATEIARLEPEQFYDALARFELILQTSGQSYPATFRRGLSKRLNDIFREAFREPTLQRLTTYPLRIDLTRNSESVASEMQVVNVKAFRGNDLKVECRMGKEVHDAKLQALTEDGADLSAVIRRFLPSPKRYFGTEREPFPVMVGQKEYEVTVNQLMRAGWKELINMAERVREQDPDFRSDKGTFRKVVVTYPTVAPPSIRQQIPELLKDLNVDDVRTDYDEAVAAAIFYMFREYSGVEELGLESFKARSKTVDRLEREWAQNILLLDIGGGTTDVALMTVTLSEEKVFDPGEDPGAGGRFYKISPRLRSSTGNTRLGGEWMTLRVFRLLKLMIADRILKLVQENMMRHEGIKNLLTTGLPVEAKDKQDRYVPGWLVKAIDQSKSETNRGLLNQALEVANRVLPTRWEQAGEAKLAALQAFYSLWELAEQVKCKLCSRPDDDTTVLPYQISSQTITELLHQCYPGNDVWSVTNADRDFPIQVQEGQANHAIESVVDSAVKYAKGAVEQLGKDENVDWLILSGQSCHLRLVREKIRQVFQQPPIKFIWNSERVTFVPEYAKLSTSIGACIAEYYRRYSQHPRESKETLRRGINVVNFEIDNLFNYLPCSFLFGTIGDNRVLKIGTELTELDEPREGIKLRGKARSSGNDREWLGVALQNDLVRVDFEGASTVPWGGFDGQTLINKHGIDLKDWQANFRLRFEVDHRLYAEVLVARFARASDREPHYQFTNREAVLDLKAAVSKLAAAAVPKPGQDAPVPTPAPIPVPSLFQENDKGKVLQWVIVYVNPQDSNQRVVLFDPSHMRPVTFHFADDDKKTVAAWLSTATVPYIEGMSRVRIYACPAGSKTLYPLREIDLLGGKPTFRRNYRFSLDENGILRAHPGETPYWESNDAAVLKDQPGRVYRAKLSPRPRPEDEEVNPFSGLN